MRRIPGSAAFNEDSQGAAAKAPAVRREALAKSRREIVVETGWEEFTWGGVGVVRIAPGPGSCKVRLRGWVNEGRPK
jgi:hypothetical protein